MVHTDPQPTPSGDDALRRLLDLARFSTDRATDAVCWLSEDGVVVHANAAAVALFGQDVAALIGRPLADIEPTLIPGGWLTLWTDIAHRGTAGYETRIRPAHARAADVEVSASAVRHEGRAFACVIVHDVSERTAAEAQLRAQVERLRVVARLADTLAGSSDLGEMYEAAMASFSQALGLSRLAILVADAAGTFRFVRWSGLSAGYRAAVEGHSFWASTETDPKPVVIADVATDPTLGPVRELALAEGIRGLVAIPLLAKGRLLGKCMGYFDQPGAPGDEALDFARTIARYVAVAVERGRSEAALVESNTLLRAIMDGTNNGVAAKDLQGRYLLMNAAAGEIAGLRPEDVIGHTAGEVFSPAIAAVHDAQDRAVLAGGQRVTYTEELPHLNGQRHVLRITKGPLFRADGQPMGVFMVGVDLTAQLAAEAEARRQDARFRALVEHSSDFVSIVSPTGTVLYTSPAAHRLFGDPGDADVGQNIFAFLHPDDIPRVRAGFEAVLRSGPHQRQTLETRVGRADGSWIVLESVATNRCDDPEIGGIVVNSRDVTERRRLEEQLRQSQKLEAIGRVTGGVAHDFNNMLLVVNGNCDVLLQIPDLGPVARDAVREIEAASERAAQLTRQLLALGRTTSAPPRPGDINQPILGLVGLLRRLIGEHIHMDVRLSPDPCVVRIDRGEFEQVVLNLALNGRDAMPDGGTLTIETQLDAARRVSVLRVRDTGCGMSPETAERMFEPFFTTKDGLGTGLGLATVYRVLSRAGAVIDVRSTPGEGTTITVDLPCAEAQPADWIPLASRVPVRGDETVLVVEDEDMVRRIASQTLAGKGYRVLEAASGEEALRRFGGADAIDLLLTDVVMPGMNGRTLAERLSACHPGLRVAYMSGYTDLSAVRHVEWDNRAFIQKPFRTEVLARFVREALDRDAAPDASSGEAVS